MSTHTRSDPMIVISVGKSPSAIDGWQNLGGHIKRNDLTYNVGIDPDDNHILLLRYGDREDLTDYERSLGWDQVTIEKAAQAYRYIGNAMILRDKLEKSTYTADELNDDLLFDSLSEIKEAIDEDAFANDEGLE